MNRWQAPLVVDRHEGRSAGANDLEARPVGLRFPRFGVLQTRLVVAKIPCVRGWLIPRPSGLTECVVVPIRPTRAHATVAGPTAGEHRPGGALFRVRLDVVYQRPARPSARNRFVVLCSCETLIIHTAVLAPRCRRGQNQKRQPRRSGPELRVKAEAVTVNDSLW